MIMVGLSRLMLPVRLISAVIPHPVISPLFPPISLPQTGVAMPLLLSEFCTIDKNID